MIGKTNAQVIGDSTKYETAVINLTSNQSSATALISSGQLNNYTNPAAVAYTAEADNVRTINLNYSTFLLTLQVSVDTAASSTIGCTATVTVDSNGKTLTYTSEFSNVTTTNSTNQIYIPYSEGSEVNVAFSDIAGYASVSDQSVSMSSSGATITVQYLIQSEEALTY